MPEERLVIRVDEKGAIVVSRNIEGVGDSAKATGGALQLLKRALGVLVGAMVIRQLIGLADAFTVIQNKLKIVTTGAEHLTQTTNQLFEMSKRTRSSFEETAASYAKFALAANQLGRSQEEVMKFTELVNKAVVIGGSSAMEAAGGMRQLSQGLASGALRGDELRSVLENLPFVADVIARSLGITRGELRALGQEGKITAELVLDAFKTQGEYLDAEYAKTVMTVGQAVTLLQNSFMKLVGEFSKSRGITAKMAEGLSKLADNMDTLVTATKALGIVLAITFSRQIVGQAAILMTGLSKAIIVTSVSMNKLTVASIPALGTALKGLGLAFKQLWLAVVSNPLFALGAVAIGGLVAMLDHLNRKMDEAEAQQERAHSLALQMIRRRLKVIQAVNKESKALTAYIDVLKNENELLRLSEEKRDIRVALMKAEKAKTKELTDGERLAIITLIKERHAIVAGNEAMAERLRVIESIKGPQKEFESHMKILNSLRKEGVITEQELTRERVKAEVALQAALETPTMPQEQEKLDPAAASIASLEQENKLLQQNKMRRMATAEIMRVQNALAREGKKLSATKALEIEQLVFRNQAQEFYNELVEDGIGTQRDYNVQMAVLKQLLSESSFSMVEFTKKYNQLMTSLEADEKLAKGGGTGPQILSSIFDNGINALNDMDRSWKKFVSGFLADLARMAQQQLMFNIIQSLGKMGVPGFSGKAQHGLDFMVGGNGGTDSQPVAFSATPGERVRVDTPAQQRASMATSVMSAPILNLKIINLVDSDSLKEYMASDEGGEVVLNHIQKNGDTVRQVVS